MVLAFSSVIKFEKDSHEESPISIITKGFFDPSVSGEAKISAFLKLANELIPLEELTMFHLLLSFKYMEDSTFQFPHTLLKLVMESTFKLLTLNFQLT